MRDIRFRAWLKNAKCMDYPVKNQHLFMWYESENQPMEIMQFTGLKDKSGREIYEGDIVYIAGLGLLKVVWDVSAWSFEHPSDGYRYDYQDVIEDLEYIKGNIYENPDLITQ